MWDRAGWSLLRMTLPFREVGWSASLQPAATDHAPGFIAAPGQTDVLMVGVAVFLVVAVLAIGLLFLRLHTLPERMAHRGHKLQFEIVAVLGLLALFTHMHIFWVAGLLLALIDIPDFGGWLGRMTTAVETIAGKKANDDDVAAIGATATSIHIPDPAGTAPA